MKKNFGVYVLSYRRKNYLFEMIDSILKQTLKDFDLIVSENSGTPEVAVALEAKYKGQITVLRRPALKSLDHINSVILDAKSKFEYFCMLHDDDTLAPEFLKKTLTALTNAPQLSAVSTNAQVINASGERQPQLLNPHLKTDQLISKSEQLAIGYMNKFVGITGFPTYVYRSDKIENLIIDSNEGGKHADATFLMKLLDNGAILQLAEPLYNYRIHGLNDSATIALRDTVKMSRFFLKHTRGLNLTIYTFILKNMIKKLKQSLS